MFSRVLDTPLLVFDKTFYVFLFDKTHILYILIKAATEDANFEKP